MDYFFICLCALLGSGLTLFSGFGLGTIMVPVFALFFEIELAIALTAIVHFLNNVFKLLLFGKYADTKVLLTFGIPSIIAAFAGALLLNYFSNEGALFVYTLAGRVFEITILKLTIASLLIFFSLFEVIPFFTNLQFNRKYLPIGGLLSGFFGGLSGMQGALRSAFLIKCDLSKDSFIGTGVTIACLIDVARLGVYWEPILSAAPLFDYTLIIWATISAFLGAFIGNLMLKKITISAIQKLVAIVVFVFAILLGCGMI